MGDEYKQGVLQLSNKNYQNIAPKVFFILNNLGTITENNLEASSNPGRMVKVRKQLTTNAREKVRKGKPSVPVRVEGQTGTVTKEISVKNLQNLKTHLSHDPVRPLFGILLKEFGILLLRYLPNRVHYCSSTMDKTWKQPKRLLIVEWIMKM